ncbi:FecCD family ABC transporter permease [Magnetospirillum fulvum]|uniref:Iron complex transport system permease protein n=1 Tax=Magnetospirillum fulvum TaxID=1082 RepID=A0A1H6IVQ0_MAGFU|nr:iron ABC transporter permease [Magnetospirillum fulvum]SEH51167.1 iron complex transport system permease protein [Magnetospirillum fulvum]
MVSLVLSAFRADGGKIALASLALLAAFLLSLLIGRYPVDPAVLLPVLAGRLFPLLPSWPPEVETVLLHIRLPRLLAAMLVGAALAASGAAYQGIFKNPLVSPDILGVSAGASFGAALAILFHLGPVGIQGAAFAGGLLAVGATYLIASWRRGRGDSVLVLVLGGIVVGTVFHAFVSLVKFVADPTNTLPAITFWLMGSLASIGLQDLKVAALPILAALVVLMLLRWRLNVMSFGDEEARSLGIDVGRTRLAVVVCATLMTAAAVAISGVVGLVGLVVPHVTRMLVGPNFRVLLPTCTLVGATFLLVVDDLARGLVAGEIPLGILTALIGAPFFFFLLLKTEKGWA